VDPELERLIDRELKRLPAPRAPRALLPRIMAAVATPRVLPWYSRPWLSWPPQWQVLSIGMVAAIGYGVWLVSAQAPQLVELTSQMSAVSRTLWNVLFGPIAFVVLGLTIIFALACAAAWTAVSRVTFGGASSQ
jgi:hypothetical protein